ncbi:HalOD1 output domain-containing protein [Haloarcula salinisoli]|uniref:Halobacterial output domain-containing protein n=1 Tax=Haloarcula salinisoli TaxID=2487746 RepID=A0A8J8C8C5_9EURY|nr:HalOD1 output domain-containing protein [Halomicroarcula salinisoli]MBX0304197.1 hypothetical protein [Halomicroarcula salinisoli]
MRHANTLEFAPETTPTVSERVIHTIADRDGISPLDISPPLFDAVDPDALDRLCGDSDVTVAFEFAGYRVTVRDGSRVELTPLDAAGD